MFNKNIKKAICIALLLVTVMLIFCGCGGSDDNEDDNYVYGTYEGLDEETEKQLRQDFLVAYAIPNSPSIKLKDIFIVDYYGIYDGCVVIMMTGDGMTLLNVESEGYIAGSKFSYGDSNSILAWKSGTFYHLNKAYENGLLTKENIAQIAEMREEKYPNMYKIN